MAERASTDPLWLSYLRGNPEAISDFIVWVARAREDIRDDVMNALLKDDELEPKFLRGELRALDKLHHLSTIADRQRSDHQEHLHIKGDTNVRRIGRT